jgi:hypothetical protein
MAAWGSERAAAVPLDQASTIIVVVEMSEASWLVSAIVPGLDRRPLKKLVPDPEALGDLLKRWSDEAERAGSVFRRGIGALSLVASCVADHAGATSLARRRMSLPRPYISRRISFSRVM